MRLSPLFILILSWAHQAAALEKSGIISASETWRGVINVTGDIVTRNGADITVESGSRIVFDGTYSIKIATDSILSLEGTAQAPVLVDGGTDSAGISISGGRGQIRHGRFRNVTLGVSYVQMAPPLLLLEDSVFVGGRVSTYHGEIVIRRNLIVGRGARNTFVGDHSKAEVVDNVFAGGTWVTKALGGVVKGNVFVSEPVPAGANQDDYTHEHVLGIKPGARVERNIFVGRSYAALMSIGADNADGAIIRNNTIDMRGTGAGFMFHMADPKPQGVVFRNNIVMNGDGIIDEQKTVGAVSYADYNLFLNVGTDYAGVSMPDRRPGDDGFGKHDVRAQPGSVVSEPEVGYPFPFGDDELFTGARSIAAVRRFYTDAYRPRSGSPAIDAGAPADAADPDVTDGRCDIGAVEFSDDSKADLRPVRPVGVMVSRRGSAGE